MKCTHCGKEAPGSAKVCSYCGTSLKKNAAEAKPIPKKKVQTKPSTSPMGDLATEVKNMPLWMWILGAVALVLVVVLLLTS